MYGYLTSDGIEIRKYMTFDIENVKKNKTKKTITLSLIIHRLVC